MAQPGHSPIWTRLQWVRLPVWSVYGLSGLLVGLGLSLPLLAGWHGLFEYESADTQGRSQALRPEMIALPGGTFAMGSESIPDARPVRQVTLSPFLLCRTEVTQSQWKAVMGSDPSDCDYGCEDEAPVQSSPAGAVTHDSSEPWTATCA